MMVVCDSAVEISFMSFNDENNTHHAPLLQSNSQVVAEAFGERGIDIAALTHQGLVRNNNEDQYAVLRRSRNSVILSTSLEPDVLSAAEEYAWLLAVADGVGGHASGERASETAIRTIVDFANGFNNWIMKPSDGLRDEISERVELYAKAIQKELRDQADSNPELEGMGTTVTAVYVFGSNAVVVSVGDSRSYLIRANEIYQVTMDHTLAQYMEDNGHSVEMTRPYNNVLTRCFSTSGEAVKVDLFHIRLEPGDQVLLCSDGLTDMVSDDEILRIVSAAATPKTACEELITTALDCGGRDNVTAVLARR